MKLLYPVLVVVCLVGTAAAETRTVDIATYTVPDGWAKEEKARTSVSHSQVDQASGRWCQLVVWLSMDASGDLDSNFATEWENLIVKNVGSMKPTNRAANAVPGWKGKGGTGAFDNKFGKGAAYLVTYSNGGKRISFSASTNNPAHYAKTIDAFFASVKLAAPTSASTTPSPAAPGKDVVAKTTPLKDGKTSKFDDGWVAVEQADWVQVSKDGVVVLIHHVLPDIRSFANLDQATGHVWNQLVAPRYSKVTNLWLRRSFYSDGDSMNGKYFASADARDAQGNAVHVALFRNGTFGRWIEIVSADKATFQKRLTTVVEQDGTNWEPLVKLATYNKFQINSGDLVGDWASSSGAAVQYVDIYTGNNAGTAYASSTETYNFRANGTYASTWKGAQDLQDGRGTRFGGASYKGTFKIKGWDITLTGRFKGATHTFTSWFESVRGGRVLHMYRGTIEEVHLIKKP